MRAKLAAEFLGTFWLVLGGCGSAVLAAAFPNVGIGLHGVSLDCRFGYGAATFITATFGFFAAARVINKVLAKHSKIKSHSVE